MTPEQAENTRLVQELTERLCTQIVGQRPQLVLAALLGTTIAALSTVPPDEQAEWINDFRSAALNVLNLP